MKTTTDGFAKIMRAFLITPDTKSIDLVDVSTLDDVQSLIGFDTLESDVIGSEGDRLYFDEECFLRGTSGRSQIDKVVPVAGPGVVVGTTDDGAVLRDVVTEIDDLCGRVKYL